jgi:hypothetical protein
MTENYKLRKAILSAFYNISQRNFGILLLLWCSFKLWWNFCPDLSRSKFHSKGERSIREVKIFQFRLACIALFWLAIFIDVYMIICTGAAMLHEINFAATCNAISKHISKHVKHVLIEILSMAHILLGRHFPYITYSSRDETWKKCMR